MEGGEMQINGPVGFVGLGNLGGRMAARLLDASPRAQP